MAFLGNGHQVYQTPSEGMSCDGHVMGDSLEWGQPGMGTVWNGDI